MYNIIRQGDADQNNILQYCCDIREDSAKLPIKDDAGSACIVIEDSSVHMLDSKGQWKEI